MPEQKTVRVRIAVTVADNGKWHAAGCSTWHDNQAKAESTAGCVENRNHMTLWIEANIPIPEPQTIEGTVTT